MLLYLGLQSSVANKTKVTQYTGHFTSVVKIAGKTLSCVAKYLSEFMSDPWATFCWKMMLIGHRERQTLSY